jgi:hypothetical protein
LIAALLALSWLGLFIHNSIELPSLNLLSPENSLPALVAVLLFIGWWLPTRRLPAGLLLMWGLHLVGGAIVTVIPFSFLPFVPEQDFTHYFAHFPPIADRFFPSAATSADLSPGAATAAA